MFSLTLSTFLGTILCTVLVYLVILVSLRLSGKSEISQVKVFNLVVLL